jgi:hypothetical protein
LSGHQIDLSQKRNSGENSNQLIFKVSNLLQRILIENDSPHFKVANPFRVTFQPSISIQKYIKRIAIYSALEESTIIISLIFLDRICKMNSLQIDKLSIHRLTMTSILIAIKVNEDRYFSNNQYARIVGLGLKEINRLEQDFLKLIRYTLFVSIQEFSDYQRLVQNW